MPSISFSIPTTEVAAAPEGLVVRRDVVLRGPFSASTAAHWLIEQGFDVDCDWILRIAPISSVGPAA